MAILQAFEAALDPDGDGDVSDAVDVINLSLGAAYGLIEDALSGAAANAVRMGVTVVASAGNSGDRPYVDRVTRLDPRGAVGRPDPGAGGAATTTSA